MFEEKKSWLKKAVVFLLISIVILLLYFYYYVDVPQMLDTLKGADILIFSLAVTVSILDVFFFAVAWRFFLSALSAKVSLKKLFTFVWASIFIDLIVPAEAISGEVSRVYMVSKEPNFDAGKAVASVVAQRIVAMVITIVSIVASIVTLVLMKYTIHILVYYFALLITILTTIFIVLVLLFCFREKWTDKLVSSLLNFINSITRKRWNTQINKLKKDLARIRGAFHKGITTFRAKPKNLVVPVFFSLLSWFCSVLVSYLVFASLGKVDIPFAIIVLVYSLIWSLKSVPIGVPAEFLIPIMGMTLLYGIFGVSVNISAAAAILINIITAWLRVVIGFVAIQWVGIKVLTGKAKL